MSERPGHADDRLRQRLRGRAAVRPTTKPTTATDSTATQHEGRTSRRAWPPAAGCARPGGPAGSAACRPAPRRRPSRRPPRDTATGRNSGSTIASAATANSDPLASTADRNAGPSPGRGAMPVTDTSTATSVGSALSSRIVTQVRGRRNSLASSTRIIGAPGPSAGSTRSPRRRCARARRPPASAARARARRTRIPSATSRAFSAAASAVRITQPVAVARLDAAVQQRDDRRDVGRTDAPCGRWAPAAWPAAPAARGDRGRGPRPGVHSCSTSASRWLDRKIVVPAAFSREQQLADLADALRVEAVGRLVEHQQPRLAQQGRRQPEPLPHPERVGLDRPATRRHRARPARARRRPAGVGCARPPVARPARVEQRAGWCARRGARTPPAPPPARRPTAARRARPRHRAAEQLDRPRRRQHQPEQHPDRGGLARAVGAQEAVDVALAARPGRRGRRRSASRNAWSARGCGS